MSHQVLKQLPQADSISSITIAGASAGLIQVDMLLFLTKLIFKTSSILSPSKYVGLCFNVFTIICNGKFTVSQARGGGVYSTPIFKLRLKNSKSKMSTNKCFFFWDFCINNSFPSDIHCLSDGIGEDTNAGGRQSYDLLNQFEIIENKPRFAAKKTSQEQFHTSPGQLDLVDFSGGWELL